MLRRMLVGFGALAVLVVSAGQAQDAERAAVRRAALDYIEMFYNGDSTLTLRSVHPDVRKIGYYKGPDETAYSESEMPFARMLTYVRNVKDRGSVQPADAPKGVEIFEVLDQTAAVKVTATWGIDYLLLAKYDGRWKVINVLWQSAPSHH